MATIPCMFCQAGGQEAAVIMSQSEVAIVSQLLGLDTQNLVVCLTQKETVSRQIMMTIKFGV